jgi:iron(III) transport system substrate-binding protein
VVGTPGPKWTEVFLLLFLQKKKKAFSRFRFGRSCCSLRRNAGRAWTCLRETVHVAKPGLRRHIIAAGLCLPLTRFARADAPPPPWIVPDLLGPAQKEGLVTVFSSTNEQEGLPLWNLFTQATGIKVNYVRAADAGLIARIAVEARAGQPSWDVLNTPTINETPAQFLAQFDPPEAKALIEAARDPERRWFGCYGNYNAPAYNTKLVQPEQLPKSYEAFLDHPEWTGKLAVEGTDKEWLWALLKVRGEEEGTKLVKEIVAKLKPVVTDGHLALARSVSAGEYPVALNDYVMLTENQRLAGGPTDFWALDPVAVFFGAVAVNVKAPHPNAARLAANFMLSAQAQTFAAKTGRLPTRPDVASNPPDAIPRLTAVRTVPVVLTPAESREWQKRFRELFQTA